MTETPSIRIAVTRLLFTKFLSLARALPESARCPFAFEKRIMARLRGLQQQDKWKAWAPAMWKAALCGLSILAVVGAFARFSEQNSNELLASELETTVMASVNTDETW